jgi:hypothetical protein
VNRDKYGASRNDACTMVADRASVPEEKSI